MVAQACHPSTCRVAAGESGVQVQPQLHSEFEASLPLALREQRVLLTAELSLQPLCVIFIEAIGIGFYYFIVFYFCSFKRYLMESNCIRKTISNAVTWTSGNDSLYYTG